MASSADLARDVTVGVTSLADPASVVITGVAFLEKCDVPSGLVCDYDDYFYDEHYNNKPDYFNYDNPGNFNSYLNMYGFIQLDDYKWYHNLHGPDNCGVHCVS